MLTLVMITLAGLGASACVTSLAYTARVESAVPAAGKLVDIAGRQTHVVNDGQDGPVVLMIHGASANAREFSVSLAPHLNGDFRLLMPDRPGHGYSERFKGAEQLGVQAAQMAGVLDTLAPGQKAVVVGHSFGGAVALRLALDRPDLVSGLVLLAPVTHDWGSGGAAWYNRLAAQPVFGPIFSQIAPLAGPAAGRGGVESVFNPAPAPQAYFEEAGIGLVFRPPNFRANARDMHALRGELAAQSDRYGELEMPIIVFSGSLDTVLKPQLHTGKLKNQVPIEIVALKQEGHMPHHAHASHVADAIRRLAIGGE
jgi:pimeloyl-ACP methyl ester carboxylesterase